MVQQIQLINNQTQFSFLSLWYPGDSYFSASHLHPWNYTSLAFILTPVTPSPLILILLIPHFYLLKGFKTIHFLLSPHRHLGTSSHPLSLGPVCCLAYIHHHLSPRGSKDHLHPVQMQPCYHPLRKTTGKMTEILTKGQVSCEVWLLFLSSVLSFSPGSSLTHFCPLSAWRHWPFSLSMNTPHLHSIPRPLQGLSLVLVNTCLA